MEREPVLASRGSMARMLRLRAFWEQDRLHPVARLLLVLTVGVLLVVEVGFLFASGEFTRYDLLAIALYAGVAGFAWHPTAAAFLVMLISSVGVAFTGSGGRSPRARRRAEPGRCDVCTVGDHRARRARLR